MNDLYEVLEICLQAIEQGESIETVLFRYPDFAEELRPILEGAMNARSMATVAPSAEVVRRNRAKVLQRAAQMREAQVTSSRRIWFASLRRLAVALAMVAVLFVSGTGLVRAASTTLPGDNLYPVKRSWEDVLLLFTFDLQHREALEIEHENERLYELRLLFANGRTAEVEFAGLVTKQSGNEWVVSGISVLVSTQTELRDGSVLVGSAVRVKGHTQDNNTVVAERIDLLSPDAVLPDEFEAEGESQEGPNQQGEDNSGKGPEGETPKLEETRAPEVESEPRNESFDGVVTSIESDSVTVNNVVIDVSSAEIKGTPSVGASARVEGYYDANGVFMVTKIEYQNDGLGSESNDSGSSNTDSSGSQDNGGDDHSSGNGTDDSGSHGGDDSGGGGDNSGSSGGGDG